jgi:hypothetical protein
VAAVAPDLASQSDGLLRIQQAVDDNLGRSESEFRDAMEKVNASMKVGCRDGVGQIDTLETKLQGFVYASVMRGRVVSAVVVGVLFEPAG